MYALINSPKCGQQLSYKVDMKTKCINGEHFVNFKAMSFQLLLISIIIDIQNDDMGAL